MEILDKGDVFPRITLRALSNEESELEVVEAEGVVVKTVDVNEEADVLDGVVGELLVSGHELGDEEEAVIEGGW